VAAYVGEQFASPEAVDLLRSVRRSAPDGETLTIAASDPLNLVGIVLPGDRISVLSAGRVVLQDGHQTAHDAGASRAGESVAHN
jgi:ATP-dependent Lhr-like helicase